MISFPRILFPVDFSMQNRAAAPFVKAMAVRFHSELFLVHVVEPPPAFFGTPEAGVYETSVDLSTLMEDRRAALQEFLVEELSGISVHRCALQGDPALQITQYARARQMDLIMMPTHGYGPFRSLLLGSVAAKILHDWEGAVWTTAHALEINAKPEQPWSEILCAVQDDDRDVPLIRWAGELAATQGAVLRLVHAVTGFEEQPDRGPDDPLRDFLFGVARERIEKMQAQAGTKLEIEISAGSPAKVLRETALVHRADLVVAGRGKIQKHLGRLRSNTYAIIRDAPCPVISF